MPQKQCFSKKQKTMTVLTKEYISYWRLKETGSVFTTPSSTLQQVNLPSGIPSMLKIAHTIEEKRGGTLLQWWDMQGAVQVYAHYKDAVLLEYAPKSKSLLSFALNGQNDFATRTICEVIKQLHQPRKSPIPNHLMPLQNWFESLFIQETQHQLLSQASTIARQLLKTQLSHIPLHADLHHSNILYFPKRGWLAIDPKAVIGEHYFDYAQIFCNPDLGALAYHPNRFEQQLELVCQIASLNKERLLMWIIAYSALSASWFLEDKQVKQSETQLKMTSLAFATLHN